MSTEIAKVFLADDCEGDGLLLRLAFIDTKCPIEITQAFDGAQAWEQLVTAASSASFPYALIILDLNLPRMSGLELLGKIKALPQFSNIPIVVLTSSASPKDEIAVMERKPTAFLTKPCDFSGIQHLAKGLLPYLFPKTC